MLNKIFGSGTAWIITIYIIWNFIVFLLYGADKLKAVNKKWRIRESNLIISAFLMGGIGALLGIRTFRHKTKQLKFKILIPVAIITNILIIFLYVYIKSCL